MSESERDPAQEELEAMRLRVRDYEHRFAMLDTQMRVLERERQKLSAVVNNTDAGFLVLDASLHLVWTNQQAPGLLRPGPNRGSIVGEPCNRVVCGRDSLCDVCPASQAFLTGQVAHREIRVVIDGLPHEIYATSMPIKEPDGRIEQTIVMLQDVSDLQVLREEKAGVQLLQEVAVAANEAPGIEQAMRICLDRICAHTGWPVGHVFTLSQDGSGDLVPTGLWHLDDAARYETFRKVSDQTRCARGVSLPGRVLASGQPAWITDVTMDDNFPRANTAEDIGVRAGFGFPVKVGREVVAVFEFFSSEVSEPDDRLMDLMGHIGTQLGRVVERQRAHDALRRSEEQLRHAQKMEAVGRLAGGIAHDFNNLLTVITGYSDIMRRGLSADHPFFEPMEEIKKAGDRAAALTRQLLAFSRKQVLKPEIVDLNAVIADMEKMLRRLIGEDIELITKLAPKLAKIKVDAGQIEQVILNLAVNARDAMPDGGRILIETAEVDFEGAVERSRLCLPLGPYVILAVSDTGAGMDAGTLSHIFEPFFTTKGQEKGTGLGLSTVYGIVKQSGGDIWVYSEPGHGTTFKVYLPAISDGAVSPAPEPPAAVQHGTETVLVVEDEPGVRDLIAQILKSSGYRVLAAANGGEALLTCERFSGPIDLLVTDIIMPGMSGRELAERLASLRPDLRVLYISGYTDHGVLKENMQFIQKPFTPQSLTRKVREVLSTPPGGG